MRKILLAVLLAAVVGVGTAQAKDKKKKKDKKQAPVEVLTLRNSQDTLSFASGVAATYGLDRYLTEQMHVDSAHMDVFLEAFEEATKHRNDPDFKARAAAYQIADMTNSRILPSAKKDFEGSSKQISDSMFYQGFVRGIKKDSTVFSQQTALNYMRDKIKVAQEEANAAWKQENIAWLDANKSAEGVQTTPSGLQYKVITMGTGAKPTATDKVKVKYEGKDIKGNVFDSSYKRNPQTSQFRCNQVIKGWSEALQMMPVGSKWELYIPQELAYGERQAGRIKPYSTLIFTVELEDIVKDEPKETAKPAVKTATKTAKKAPVRRTIKAKTK